VEDEDQPRKKSRRLELVPLDLLSIADLNEYIIELAAEIARVKTVIASKEKARNAAEGFFRTP